MDEIKRKLLEQIDIKKNVNQIYRSEWIELSEHKRLSEDFIRVFQDYVDWYYISIYQKLSEEFIREFKEEVIWTYISQHQKLSETFIKEFKNELDWDYITEYQSLSEEFIQEFQHQVDWTMISGKFILTDEFLFKYSDKICWETYFNFNEAKFHIIKKFIFKTRFKDIDDFNAFHLNINERNYIKKILKFKYAFTK
jgi:hypothetical protein